MDEILDNHEEISSLENDFTTEISINGNSFVATSDIW